MQTDRTSVMGIVDKRGKLPKVGTHHSVGAQTRRVVSVYNKEESRSSHTLTDHHSASLQAPITTGTQSQTKGQTRGKYTITQHSASALSPLQLKATRASVLAPTPAVWRRSSRWLTAPTPPQVDQARRGTSSVPR